MVKSPAKKKKIISPKKSPRKRSVASPKKRKTSIKSPAKTKSVKKGCLKDKFHVVLDLDATLVDTYIEESTNQTCDYHTKLKFIKDKILNNPKISSEKKNNFQSRFIEFVLDDANKTKCFTIIRPHTHEFLEWCREFFKTTSVWTAGSPIYAHKIVDILFPLERPDHVFTYTDCLKDPKIINNALNHFNNISTVLQTDSDTSFNSFKAPSPTNLQQTEFSKPLLKIKNRILGGVIDINEMNTVADINSKYLKDIFIIDDRDDIFQLNPDNFLLIPEFGVYKNTQGEIMKNDTCLKLIQKKFEGSSECEHSEDIRKMGLKSLLMK